VLWLKSLVSTITPAQREYNPSLSGQHLGDKETQQQRFKTEEVNLQFAIRSLR